MITRIDSAPMAELDSAKIAAALQAAADRADTTTLGPDLTVTEMPELRGAKLSRCCVDVYVLIASDNTAITLEYWHCFGADPFKQLTVDNLDDAIKLALAELDYE